MTRTTLLTAVLCLLIAGCASVGEPVERAYLVLAIRTIQSEPPAEGFYIAGELRDGQFHGDGGVEGDGTVGDGHPGWLELGDLSFHGAETGRAPFVPYVEGVLGADGVFWPTSREVKY